MVSDLVPFLVSMRFISHTMVGVIYITTFSFFFFYTRVKKVMNYSCVSKDALLGSCVQLLVRDV